MRPDQPGFHGVPLDTATLPQGLLNIENKHRSNLFPWTGQFSPQLVEVLLRAYAAKSAVVLDPFVGSGTVLCEAGSIGLPVIGAEINPAAVKMAQIYCLMNLPVAKRKMLADRVEDALHDYLRHRARSLFESDEDIVVGGVKGSLIEIHSATRDRASRSIVEALVVLVDFCRDLTEEDVFSAWARLRARLLNLPECGSPITLLNCDARRLPLRDNEVGLVVTSPPYVNVFNYHQQYRRSAEALGWDLLAVARSEIGANRKHRGNRFLTVIQYCLDMTDVLRELQRVCKEGARAILVVGRESNVRKTRFFNGEILATLASCCVGLPLTLRQERVFTNRFGESIYEDILHFEVPKEQSPIAELPAAIARQVLADARDRAPRESIEGLEDALRQADKVRPSPLYDRRRAVSRSTTVLGKGVLECDDSASPPFSDRLGIERKRKR